MNIVSEYTELNRLAGKHGIVIMGTSTLSSMRFNEMLGDYGLGRKVYNRSSEALTAKNAIEFFRANVETLFPEVLFVGIGENEEQDSKVSIREFEQELTDFAAYINRNHPQTRLIFSEIAGDSKRAAMINQAIKRVCKSGFGTFAALPKTNECLNIKYFKSIKPFLFGKRMGFADAFAYSCI